LRYVRTPIVVILIVAIGYYFYIVQQEINKWGPAAVLSPAGQNDFNSDWIHFSGTWEFENKQVISTGEGQEHILYYRQPSFGNIAVEFKAMIESEEALVDGGDLSIILCSDKVFGDRYDLQLGAELNQIAIIYNLDQPRASCPFQLKVGKTYLVRAEREGDKLRLFCDGKLILSTREIFSLDGGYFGIYTYGKGKRFWDIKVFAPEMEEGQRRLVDGDLQYFRSQMAERDREYFLNAAETTYSSVYKKNKDNLLGYRALLKRSFLSLRTGKSEKVKKNLEILRKFKEKDLDTILLEAEYAFTLEDYKKSLGMFQQAIENFPFEKAGSIGLLRNNMRKGVVLDIPLEMQVKFWKIIADVFNNTDLFICTHSQLKTVNFLQGQKFQKVYCGYNQISSLSGIEKLPIIDLKCQSNLLTDLSLIKGLKLEILTCDRNNISSLEPLRGMLLKKLGIHTNNITSLEPIRDLPLESLYMGQNPINHLEDLKKMPLRALGCDLMKLKDLGPLKGKSLKNLICYENLISSLEPLKGMPLTWLDCSRNPIDSLMPLKGMELKYLNCQETNIKSLEPFVENPPRHFLFCSPTLPLAELDRVIKAWDGKEDLASHKYEAEFWKVYLKKDVAAIKNMALSFRGNRYMIIPMEMKWSDGEKLCKELGGHLVSITSKKENKFIQSLPHFNRHSWNGLYREKNEYKWVTGEKFTFKYFKDRTLRSSSHFYMSPGDGKWRSAAKRHKGMVRRSLIIEWEK